MTETQPNMFETPKFFGDGIDEQETVRLTAHLICFIDFVKDGREYTLRQVSDALGMLDSSASARWRQVKALGGEYEKRKDEKIRGLKWYRLTKVPEGYGE